MTVQAFLLHADQSLTDEGCFELRYGAHEHPFRLTLRPATGRYSLNALSAGELSQEQGHDLPANFGTGSPILVLREDLQVMVASAAGIVSYALNPAEMRPEWPTANSEHLSAQYLSPNDAPCITWQDGTARIEALPIPGLPPLPVPRDLSTATILDWFVTIRAQADAWLLALATEGPNSPLPPPRHPAEAALRAALCPPQAAERPRHAAPDPQSAIVPGLDVVVALYNQQDYVVECLDSLLAVESDRVRVLVVDDGSTDDSVARVRAHFGSTPRLEVVQKPNGGCASARNFGRLMSDRSHIAFVDADDLTDPGFHAALFALAQATRADMTLGSFDTYSVGAVPERTPYETDQAMIAGRKLDSIGGEPALELPPLELLAMQPAIWRAVFSRQFLDAVDLWFPESVRAFDDFAFHLSSACLARKVWMAPAQKYLYRQHPQQDVRQADERHFANLAMSAAALRTPATAQSLDAILRVLNWSVQSLPDKFSGAFLQASVEMLYAASRAGLIAEDALRDVITHPDFRARLRIEAQHGHGLPSGRWWLHSEPAASLPGIVTLTSILARRG